MPDRHDERPSTRSNGSLHRKAPLRAVADDERPDGYREIMGSPGWLYEPGGGPLAYQPASGKGGPRKYLAATPQVLERHLILDASGQPIDERYRLVRHDGLELALTLDELHAGRAWKRLGLPGRKTTTQAAIVDMLRDQADRLEPALGLQRTGWHELAGALWHAHPSGELIGPPGASRPRVELLDLPPELVAAAAPIGSGDPVRGLATIIALGDLALAVVAAAARSLISTPAPPRSALALEGRPGAGKTTAALLGRALVAGDLTGSPPITATFEDTATSVELQVGREHDLPTLIDDYVDNPDALPGERGASLLLLNRLVRATENAREIRRRASRDMTLREGSTVRSFPAITMERWPQAAPSSLIRRTLIVPVEPGSLELAYIHGNRQLAADLRALGTAIIRMVAASPPVMDNGQLKPRLAVELAAREQAIGRRLIERKIVPPESAWRIAALLGGLRLAGMAAELGPIDAADMRDQLIEAARPWTAEQLERFTARIERTTNLPAAAGELLRKAFPKHWAHVRDADGLVRECVPGWTEQQHGHRSTIRDGLAEPVGDGPPVYYLPDRGAFGIAKLDLHGLAVDSRDPRLGGYAPRALEEALGRAGALLETHQKDRRWGWQKWIGGHNLTLMFVRAELLGVECGNSHDGDSGSASGASGARPQVDGLALESASASPQASDQHSSATSATSASPNRGSAVSASAAPSASPNGSETPSSAGSLAGALEDLWSAEGASPDA